MLKKIKTIINYHRLNLESFFRKIGLFFQLDREKMQHLKVIVKCRKRWYGNSYGGFYVNPELLNQDSIVYSFGIGKDISFDKKIMSKHGCKVYGFDPTPKSISFIHSQKINPLFIFHPFGISTKTGPEEFYLPKNKKAVSGSMAEHAFIDLYDKVTVEMKTLSEIMQDLGHEHIDVLKIDIEGSEYDVVESILQLEVPIKQILIEFHDRFFDTEEYKSKKLVESLSAKGYKIFAKSLSAEEVSFITE